MKLTCQIDFLDFDPLVLSYLDSSTKCEIIPQTKSNEVNERLYTRKELMALLNICSTTLYYRMIEGLPHFRVGRKVYFRETEIFNYFKKKKLIFIDT